MRILLFALLLLHTTTALSQKINEATSFSEALQKAEKRNKLVFVQFESATCNQCNEVADMGIGRPEVRTALASDFVFLKISPSHKDRAQIGESYNIAKGFGVLFVHHSGSLAHKFASSSSMKDEYESQMQIALKKANEVDKSAALERGYKNGNRNTDFLEQYLLHRQTLNLATDSLLDEYVRLLPPDSLRSIRTLAFIARLAPALTSYADGAIRKDRSLFDKAWFSLDLSTRININNTIISKTMNRAVAAKDTKLAIRTAAFAKGVNSNPEAGERNNKRIMMLYYRQVKDTTAYFENAVAFYTRYYMNIPVDSVKRVDSINQQKMLQQAVVIDTVKNGRPAQMRAISFAPSTQRYTNELNDAAWHLYTMTDNLYLLSIATAWVEKGLQFFDSPEALHTYAYLLYKQGHQQKAIEALNRSIAIRKERQYPTDEYEAALQKMKAGLPLAK